MSVKETIDTILWALFPNFKRRLSAAKLAKRYYKSASRNRNSWITDNPSPNQYIEEYSRIRGRANFLYHNEPFVRSAVDILTNRIVGKGAVLQATTSNESFNQAAENAFRKWSRTADYYRQYHFGDIQRLLIQKLFLDGGVFINILPDESNNETAPFSLEIIEYQRLATAKTSHEGNKVFWGVEIDKDNRVVAYHFEKYNQFNVYSMDTVRIPAEQIIHFSPFRRPHQVLGIPLLAPSIVYAFHLAELLEAELINAKISAAFGIVIKKNNPYQAVQQATDENESGEREIEIAPGMVEYLEPGEDIEVVDPKRPSTTFDSFVKIILRGIGRGIGLAYEQISGDKSGVNYSSARHSELELRDYILPFRHALEVYFLDRIYEEFIKYGVRFGTLNVQGAIKDWRNWTQHRWIHKGFEWVDPLKDAQATRLQLLTGLTTLADEAAAKGKDWQELIKQRAKEIKFLKENGVLDISQTLARSEKEVEHGSKVK